MADDAARHTTDGGGGSEAEHAGRARLIAALDTADPATARQWATALAPCCAHLKLGLEFFVANGPDAVAALDPGRIFLDLKLHDIPATVAGGAGAAGRLGVAMLTVHAAGGAAMIAAAREALERASPRGGATRTRLLAVTVLTSLDAEALGDTGVPGAVADQVRRLAVLAVRSGADGLVCSPSEARLLRETLGPAPLLVVPGVRPHGAAVDDQARVATPAQAARDGASFLVVGRPITRAADPRAAARAIAREIGEAVPSRPR